MDHDKGLDADGHFVREGSLDRVQPEFAALVEAARAGIADAFGPDRLHSAYLYGSVPRGTARSGRSDLDLLLALHRPPTAADRADADRLAAQLDGAHPEVDGVGVLLSDTDTLLGEPERYDLGWFLACLCTPLLGPDLAGGLPRYRPNSLLARETNGDYPLHLARWQAGQGTVRGICRVTVRSAFTLVMPRWGGWTSDLLRSAEIAGSYYPEWAGRLREVARAALGEGEERDVRRLVTEELGPWLAAEYTAVHGTKAPRP